MNEKQIRNHGFAALSLSVVLGVILSYRSLTQALPTGPERYCDTQTAIELVADAPQYDLFGSPMDLPGAGTVKDSMIAEEAAAYKALCSRCNSLTRHRLLSRPGVLSARARLLTAQHKSCFWSKSSHPHLLLTA